MTTFSQRISARAGDHAVIVVRGSALGADALTSLAPQEAVGTRPALSICDPGALLRVLAAFDGWVEAILLLSAELPAADVLGLMANAGATALVSDREDLDDFVSPNDAWLATDMVPKYELQTDWIMTTSGTTGRPKMVAHSLDRLTRTVGIAPEGVTPVWGLNYEATRFAGMQVLLQAVLGGGTLIAPALSVSLGERLAEFAREGVTHLSATPTLWRRILMHPASRDLALCQITLGGEIADQPLLDQLAARFPQARITHIYASTEVGVGFSVKDGRAGFPAEWLETPPGSISIRINKGRLWLHAPDGVGEMLGEKALPVDAEGYIDSLDRVEHRGDRVVFLGRDTGVVNVGGTKVHPETVETTLNSFSGIALARVSARKNPFSGAILVAEVVADTPPQDPDAFRTAVIRHCRNNLPLEAVPAVVKLVDEIEVNAAGKLTRKT